MGQQKNYKGWHVNATDADKPPVKSGDTKAIVLYVDV